MDPLEKIERKRQARHRIRAQRERAGRLKSRVVAISLICFALLWGVVFVQMATGNDPVLGDSSSAAVKRSGGRNRQAAQVAPAESSASTDSEEFGATEPEELKEEAVAEEPVEAEAEPVEAEFIEEEPAPVTTSQS
jgi:cytoskeletal protein RodZ